MKRLTTADLVGQIRQLVERLGEQHIYGYVSGRSRLRVEGIKEPEGPIAFVNIKDDGSAGRPGSISSQMLAKVAATCSKMPNHPLHIDRLFSAGGNSRSALETLLAYTPHFFICYPERVDVYTGETRRNLKHIMWCPDEEHPWGEMAQLDYNEVITEVELGVDFGPINVTPADLGKEFDSIEAKTVHTQMQVALIEIGNVLDFDIWIARNDRSIQVGDRRLIVAPDRLRNRVISEANHPAFRGLNARFMPYSLSGSCTA